MEIEVYLRFAKAQSFCCVVVVRPNSWFSRSVLWISEVFITLIVSSSSRLRTCWNHDIFLKVALLDNLANRSGLHRRFRAELANSLHLYSAAGKEMEGGFRSRWSKEAFCILHFSKSDAESFWSRCGFCFYISQGMCERALIPETLRSEMLWLNRPWRGATAASLLMLSTSPTSPFSKDSY